MDMQLRHVEIGFCMIVLHTNVIPELRKKPLNQGRKVCAWSQTHPARAFYLTTLSIMVIEPAP